MVVTIIVQLKLEKFEVVKLMVGKIYAKGLLFFFFIDSLIEMRIMFFRIFDG